MRAEIVVKSETVIVDIETPTIEIDYHLPIVEVECQRPGIEVECHPPETSVEYCPGSPIIHVIGKVGLMGPRGYKGDKGDPGQQVQMRSTDFVIQWKYETASAWEDLMDVESLLGETVTEIIYEEIAKAIDKYEQVNFVDALPLEDINPNAIYIVRNGGGSS